MIMDRVLDVMNDEEVDKQITDYKITRSFWDCDFSLILFGQFQALITISSTIKSFGIAIKNCTN